MRVMINQMKNHIILVLSDIQYGCQCGIKRNPIINERVSEQVLTSFINQPNNRCKVFNLWLDPTGVPKVLLTRPPRRLGAREEK